jgi:hypothetical protein
MPDDNGVFRVPEANKPLLDERIAKLNKRARKLGCPEIVLNVTGSEDIPIHGEGSQSKTIVGYRRILFITVQGAAPKIAGWEFIAVIEPTFDEEGNSLGNILRNVPGAQHTVPEQYRTAGNQCDHCHTARRRLETFVLANDAGETKQVGRNCLVDFLGHTNPETYCSYAEILMDARDLCIGSEDEEYFGVRQVDRFVAEEVLQLAACAVRVIGWRSKATARLYDTLSTSDDVLEWIYAKPKERAEWKTPLLPSDEDKATATEIVAWLETLQNRTDLNDYMYNLSVLGKGAMFTTKNFGLACSAIPTYLREKEREINKRKQYEDYKNSQYVGTVGKRDRFELTLVYMREFESDFGVTHMHKFRDESGNVFIWFASNIYWNPVKKQDIDLGDTVTLYGTVKAHEEYDGIKQTKLSRCVEWKSKEQKKAEAAERKRERLAAQSTQGETNETQLQR